MVKEEVSSSNLDAGSTTLLEFKSGLHVFRQPVEEVFRLHGGILATQLSGRELANLVKGYVAAARARGLSRSTLENSYGPPLRRIFIPWCDGERGTAAIRRVAAIPRPVVEPAPRYGRETGALTTGARNQVDQFLWAHSLKWLKPCSTLTPHRECKSRPRVRFLRHVVVTPGAPRRRPSARHQSRPVRCGPPREAVPHRKPRSSDFLRFGAPLVGDVVDSLKREQGTLSKEACGAEGEPRDQLLDANLVSRMKLTEGVHSENT